MIKKIQTALTRFFSLALLRLVPVMAPVAVYAQTSIQDSVCSGANDLQITTDGTGSGCAEVGGDTNGINSIISMVINVFSVIVGIIAVIMIIWGGLRYITSGGDSGKITNAKNTILYALIGLVIVALAQFIVKFVLGKVTNATV